MFLAFPGGVFGWRSELERWLCLRRDERVLQLCVEGFDLLERRPFSQHPVENGSRPWNSLLGKGLDPRFGDWTKCGDDLRQIGTAG